MTPRRSAIRKVIGSLIIVAMLQFYVIQALAAPGLSSGTAPQTSPSQPEVGRLSVAYNKSILVNGINRHNCDTVTSGSTVETPDGVGATISSGRWGAIDIAPNSKLLVEFSAGMIKITIIVGCAIVRTKTGTYGQIYTEKGLATQNDPNLKPSTALDVCFPSGAPEPIVDRGAAANAGAGARDDPACRAIPIVWIWLGVLGGGGGVAGLVAAAGGGGGGGIDPSNPLPTS